MRCHICNSDTDTITYDRTRKEFTPCSECQAVIYECVISYDDVDDDILMEENDVGC